MTDEQKNKEVVEFIKPFGPMILKVKLPEDILNDLNQDCLDIADSKKEKIDWSDQLGLADGLTGTLNWIKDNFNFLKDYSREYIHKK